jgi:hypothetical protein
MTTSFPKFAPVRDRLIASPLKPRPTRRLIGRFRRDQSGAAAMTFGLMLIPLAVWRSISGGSTPSTPPPRARSMRLPWPPAASPRSKRAT